MIHPTQETTAVLVETASLMVAHAAHICVVVPRVAPTVEDVRQIHDGLDQLAQRVNSIGLLFVVAEKISPPSGDARRRVAEMFGELRPNIKVISAQLAGSGFIASAKRSVFTWATSHMLGKTPIRAFSELADATDWLNARASALGLACPSSLDLQSLVESRSRSF